MIVRDMIKWLSSLPEEMQDAVVQVGVEADMMVDFDPDALGYGHGGELWDYTDFTDRETMHPDHRRKTLELGN